jgi:hypothetical protein
MIHTSGELCFSSCFLSNYSTSNIGVFLALFLQKQLISFVCW